MDVCVFEHSRPGEMRDEDDAVLADDYPGRPCGGRGFTLVELLVVIGIIALLISILLPVLGKVRRQANEAKCAANMRQILIAFELYASEWKEKYPPNSAGRKPNPYWFDQDRVGKYLKAGTTWSSSTGLIGPVMTCPSSTNALRSYAMNVYASSRAELSVTQGVAQMPQAMWSARSKQSSKLILLAETWEWLGSEEQGFRAPTWVGQYGQTPGAKFGGGAGLVPALDLGNGVQVNCELAYQHHRIPGSGGTGTQARGRVPLGYADGHVEFKASGELADPVTGKSSLNSLWTPVDAEWEQAGDISAFANSGN